MKLEESRLRQAATLNSGEVIRYVLPDDSTEITRITTFCPDEIGPGPAHLYLIKSDALTLVDAGIPTWMAKAFFYHWRNQPVPPEVDALSSDHSEQELKGGLDLAGCSLSDIELLVISHGHPDHFLMANTVLDRAKASVAAHILDTPVMCNPWGMMAMWSSRQGQMKATGMPRPSSDRNRVIKEQSRVSAMGLAIRVDRPIFGPGPLTLNGGRVGPIEVEHLPGHSQGSLGLVIGSGKEKILLCGDVLLNPITPHPEDLLVYLRTLEALGRRDDIGLVLPAHGKPIRDLKTRVDFLKEHHRKRIELTYNTCKEPRCVWDIATMEGYFDTYVDPAKFNFLAGLEALIHLEILNMVDALERTDIRDGVHYFRRSADESYDSVYGRIRELVEAECVEPIMRY